jgi:hypothetical protein
VKGVAEEIHEDIMVLNVALIVVDNPIEDRHQAVDPDIKAGLLQDLSAHSGLQGLSQLHETTWKRPLAEGGLSASLDQQDLSSVENDGTDTDHWLLRVEAIHGTFLLHSRFAPTAWAEPGLQGRRPGIESDSISGTGLLAVSAAGTMEDMASTIGHVVVRRFDRALPPQSAASTHGHFLVGEEFFESAEAIRGMENQGTALQYHFSVDTPPIGHEDIGQQAAVTIRSDSIVEQTDPLVKHKALVHRLGFMAIAVGR